MKLFIPTLALALGAGSSLVYAATELTAAPEPEAVCCTCGQESCDECGGRNGERERELVRRAVSEESLARRLEAQLAGHVERVQERAARLHAHESAVHEERAHEHAARLHEHEARVHEREARVHEHQERLHEGLDLDSDELRVQLRSLSGGEYANLGKELAEAFSDPDVRVHLKGYVGEDAGEWRAVVEEALGQVREAQLQGHVGRRVKQERAPHAEHELRRRVEEIHAARGHEVRAPRPADEYTRQLERRIEELERRLEGSRGRSFFSPATPPAPPTPECEAHEVRVPRAPKAPKAPKAPNVLKFGTSGGHGASAPSGMSWTWRSDDGDTVSTGSSGNRVILSHGGELVELDLGELSELEGLEGLEVFENLEWLEALEGLHFSSPQSNVMFSSTGDDCDTQRGSAKGSCTVSVGGGTRQFTSKDTGNVCRIVIGGAAEAAACADAREDSDCCEDEGEHVDLDDAFFPAEMEDSQVLQFEAGQRFEVPASELAPTFRSAAPAPAAFPVQQGWSPVPLAVDQSAVAVDQSAVREDDLRGAVREMRDEVQSLRALMRDLRSELEQESHGRGH